MLKSYRSSWSQREANGDSGDIPFGLSASHSSIYYISLHSALLKGYKIKVTAMDPLTGASSGHTVLSSDSEVTSADRILFVGTNHVMPLIIWTDKSFKSLKLNVIGKKHVSTIAISPHGAEQIEKIVIHAPHTAGAQAHFLAHFQSSKSHWAEVYHVNIGSGAIRKAYDLPKKGGTGAFSTSTQGTNVYFIRNTDSESTLVSSAKNDVLGNWPMHPKSPLDVSHAVSEVVPKEQAKYAVRSALLLPSGDWKLLQNGSSLWVRNEGLAGVVAAAFVEPAEELDLAEELAIEGHSSVFAAYIHRLKRHFKDLKHLPAWAESLSSRFKANILSDKINLNVQGQQRDGFGFRKLVIVATERGRLIALDTGIQAKVIWDIKLMDLSVQQKWQVINIEVESGIALIRGSEGEFWRVETLTGKTLQYQPGGLLAGLKTAVSVLDAAGEKVLIPVLSDGSLGEYSTTKLPKGTTVITRGPNGFLRGWSLVNDANLVMAWEFAPNSKETITTVVPRPAHDPVASIGKALGDRNVLYKFLNQNLLFVATVVRDMFTVVIYILDAASGQILHVTSHSNTDTNQPITAIMSENWFAYSIFSNTMDLSQDSSIDSSGSTQSFQLIVSELFESQFPNDRGPLGSSQNFSSIYPAASEGGQTLDTPYVVSQAYSVQGPVSIMAVTSTLQGITPRLLLCFLPSLNALISIPRSYIDPRRPVGRDPSPAELEEGLYRYATLLEFDPRWVISHKRDILGISEVLTHPSLLESTSLVFAFGEVDIFGTRVAPIGAFDLLGKGFSKLQLVGTVVALALGTGVLAPMVGYLAVNSHPFLSVLLIR